MRICHTVNDHPYINPPQDFGELVEVFDSSAEPLLLMPLSRIRNSKHSRRIIQLCLRDGKNRVYVRKRASKAQLQPGLWDLSVSTHVLAGESLAGAAMRGLEQTLGIGRIRLKIAAELPYLDNSGASLLATYFLAGPCRSQPVLNPEQAEDGMFLKETELRGMVEHEPDMFSSELRWAVRSGWIFA